MLYAITSKCERYNVLYKCRKENQTMKINVIILHEDAFVAPSVCALLIGAFFQDASVAPSVCALPVDAFHQNIRGTLSVCRAH